jgi:hypothetical protein
VRGVTAGSNMGFGGTAGCDGKMCLRKREEVRLCDDFM